MTALTNFVKSFGYALHGIKQSFHNQRNIKIQSCIGILVLLLSVYYQITRTEFYLVLILTFLVLILEMVNTALEKTIDYISLERNKKLGEIKDIMAGAVLMAAFLSAVVGLIIFFPYVFG